MAEGPRCGSSSIVYRKVYRKVYQEVHQQVHHIHLVVNRSVHHLHHLVHPGMYLRELSWRH